MLVFLIETLLFKQVAGHYEARKRLASDQNHIEKKNQEIMCRNFFLWRHGLQKKNVAMPTTSVRVFGYCDLPRVSHQLRLSRNDKDDNDVRSGAVHRSPSIDLEKNPGKPRLGPSDGSCAINDCLKWGPSPTNDVGRNTQNFREGEKGGGKERTG